MLKDLYRDSMSGIHPDSGLVSKTKEAMYNQLEAARRDSDSSQTITKTVFPDNELIAETGKKRNVFGSKSAKIACAAVLVAVFAGIAVIFGVVAENGIGPGHLDSGGGFSGANPGRDSSDISVSQVNKTSVPTVIITTSASVVEIGDVTVSAVTTKITSSTAASVTDNGAVSLSVAHATTTTCTVTSQTKAVSAAVVTTTAPPPPNGNEPGENPPRDPFGDEPHRDGLFYYDPDYDPDSREPAPDDGYEFLFKEDGISYFFESRKSERVLVLYNGVEYTLRDAIDRGIVSHSQLLECSAFVCVASADDMPYSPGAELIHSGAKSELEESGGCWDMQSDLPAPPK